MKHKLTQEYLKEALTYNPDTGIFVWNVRPLNHFKNLYGKNVFNSKYSNRKAGCVRPDGYATIRIAGRVYKAHRLAFLYQEGYFPENDVDHIDRVRSNNAWSNLREVSVMCNLQNSKLSIKSSSGVTGVSYRVKEDKWIAQICISYKVRHLGIFKNKIDAVKARYKEESTNKLWKCSTKSSAREYLVSKGIHV